MRKKRVKFVLRDHVEESQRERKHSIPAVVEQLSHEYFLKTKVPHVYYTSRDIQIFIIKKFAYINFFRRT